MLLDPRPLTQQVKCIVSSSEISSDEGGSASEAANEETEDTTITTRTAAVGVSLSEEEAVISQGESKSPAKDEAVSITSGVIESGQIEKVVKKPAVYIALDRDPDVQVCMFVCVCDVHAGGVMPRARA